MQVGLWLPLAQKLPGAQVSGAGAGHQRCQGSGGGSSAWAGTLPHLLISVFAGPRGQSSIRVLAHMFLVCVTAAV